MPTWPPLVNTILSAVIGGLFVFALNVIFRRSGKRSDWYDAKDRHDTEETAKRRELEWQLARYKQEQDEEWQACKAWNQRQDDQFRAFQKTLNTLEHRLEIMARDQTDSKDRLRDLADLLGRMRIMEEKVGAFYKRIEEHMLDKYITR